MNVVIVFWLGTLLTSVQSISTNLVAVDKTPSVGLGTTCSDADIGNIPLHLTFRFFFFFFQRLVPET